MKSFPAKYQCLKQQVFEFQNFKITPIRYKDRYEIMNWRNDQISILRQKNLLTQKEQDLYFENIIAKEFDLEKPNQILFSFFKNNKLIGYGGLVRINWIDKNAEISFLMNTELEKNNFAQYWNIFLKLIEKFAFKEINLHKVYTYAFDLRPHLYDVLTNSGYVEEARLKEHSLFKNNYIDVLIHAKTNDQI